MAIASALFRCGFPYIKTLGMRRVTTGTVDVAPGENGLVYVLGRSVFLFGIRILNWDDEDLGYIGREGTNDGQFQWPVKLIVDKNQNFIILDEALNRITTMSSDGSFISKWGEYGCDEGQLNRPAGMALDKDDNLVIVDGFNHRVQKFTKEGKFLASWGQYGSEEGQFNTPWGIGIRDDGDIFISDWKNNRVQHFTEDGEFVKQFGGLSGNDKARLNRPAGVAIDEDGDVYVADRSNHRVAIFDAQGRYVQELLGDSQLMGMAKQYVRTNPVVLRLREMTQLDEQKRFRYPTSVTLSQGMLWVGDTGSHRVQIYQKNAERLEDHELESPRNSPKMIIN